ncbi:MAG: peptidoglycan DD-metalloendopeptidase family protein [Bacteroidota bacterium]
MNELKTQSQLLLRRIMQPLRQNKFLILGAASILVILTVVSVQIAKKRSAVAAMAFSQRDAKPEVMRWGLPLNDFRLTDIELRSGAVLGEILMQQGLTYPQVAKLVESSKGKFNINSMRAGRTLHFLVKTQETAPQYMVYEPSPYEFAVFNLREPYEVNIVKRDVKTEIVASSGVLETSFWQAMTDNGLNDELADGMIDILASSVDFYHQKQGDRFKVVYEQHFVEGAPVGTSKIIAAVYERDGSEYYAFNFEQLGEKCNYFDFEGRPARKAFLKSPVKFSRISSRYDLNRLHPILGYHKAHLGTDYAAPYGTPIMAVAEGVVEEATHRGGNGNFVKIRHDGTYETQYLHMQGFARGIRPGARVAQGQTIGYVGATGLATGPHCCFRFWKNGKEVDHLKLNLPQPLPITGAALAAFTPVRDGLIQMLNKVPYRTSAEIKQTEEQMNGFENLPGVAP